MDYDIMIYGSPALREKAHPVGEVTDEIRLLSEDMLRTMHRNNGLGLAAEQIGRTESICVVDISSVEEAGGESGILEEHPVEMPLVMIDPVIKEERGSLKRQEGCLSFPEIYADIERADIVTVEYTNIEGLRVTAVAAGLLSRAIQHEIDHLNGVLLVDRMSAVQRIAVRGRLKRLKSGVAA